MKVSIGFVWKMVVSDVHVQIGGIWKLKHVLNYRMALYKIYVIYVNYLI